MARSRRGTSPSPAIRSRSPTRAASASGPVAYTDANAVTVGKIANPVLLGGGQTAGLQTTGRDLTLTTGGLLTLGDGSGTVESVLAAGATVDIVAAGVNQVGNSNLVA